MKAVIGLPILSNKVAIKGAVCEGKEPAYLPQVSSLEILR